jgi:sulfate adenylyltransferase subunit 2
MNSTALDELEAESIFILREVIAQFQRPVLLYSIGKDSSTLVHLARKAFHPGRIPFPVLHVDTTWKFKEMISFRDEEARRLNFDLRVHVNREGLAAGINPLSHGSRVHTDVMKTQALRQALNQGNYDAVIGGARRDEEASRAKERIFSLRDRNHAWEPRAQRAELWRLVNGRLSEGEHMRVFPLSNWTELDVWRYVRRENIRVVPLYLARPRPVVARSNTLIMVDDERLRLEPNERVELKKVRFRTLGCYPLSGAVESDAETLDAIIEEIQSSRYSERQGRLIDFDEAGSMEKKKREGYF